MTAKESAPARALAKQHLPADINTLPPRLQRLVLALMKRPRTIRELVSIVPSNNPAEYVRQLRDEYGLTVFCEHVRFVTVDGTPSWFGRYHLTDADRNRLKAGRPA